MLKVLVTGANGQLGHDMVHCLPSAFQVKGYSKRDWEVSNQKHAQVILDQEQPDTLIHCAAYTKVDESEDYPELAYRINGAATEILASECERRRIKFVYISTDYVFNGENNAGYTEDSQPDPINVYGKSKHQGEQYITQICSNYIIARTSWLYGRNGHNFVYAILKKAQEKEPIAVVTDQLGCPTYTIHLSQLIGKLLAMDIKGIFHTANSGYCSWYDFAKEILVVSGTKYHLNPIKSEQLKRKAKRPTCSILHSISLGKGKIPTMPHWKKGVRDFFEGSKVYDSRCNL